MEFDGLANLGWREALIAVVALLALYVLVVFWRMNRLKHRALVPDVATVRAETAVAAYQAVQEPALSDSPSETPITLSDVPFPWNEPPPQIPEVQAIERLERDISKLRQEIGVLRAELLALREERQNERAKPDVTETISPFYSEAMQMAGHGADATAIAQSCGISRAEAELVLALVRNQDSN